MSASRTGRCEPQGQVRAVREGKTNLKEIENVQKKNANKK